MAIDFPGLSKLRSKGSKKKKTDKSDTNGGSSRRLIPDVKTDAAVNPTAAVDETQLLKEAFKQFDANGDGKISAEEMRDVIDALVDGSTITLEEARKMLAEADSDGDGYIDVHEFVAFNKSISVKVNGAAPCEITAVDDVELTDRQREDLTAAFAIFDVDRDGKITAEEVWRVIRKLPRGSTASFRGWTRGACPLEDCRRMIRGVDRKGLGHVDFEDFLHMMTTPA